MEEAGIDRYIGMATPSLHDERGLLGLIVPLMGKVFLPRAYRELLAMSEVVTSSRFDWTIALHAPDRRRFQRIGRDCFLGRDRIRANTTRADIATSSWAR